VDLSHVRWLAGGTGAGKSTLARLLAARYDATVYDGDRAEHGWLPRATPERHPRLIANARLTDDQRARLDPAEKFANTASLHGETIGFVLDDLAGLPADRPVLVDWFGNVPRDLAPLLDRPEHAVFLLPTPQFRRRTLTARYADPDRARANWGGADPSRALAGRLARDALWDAEIRRQAREHGLAVVEVDGRRSPADIATELAVRFGL
jgi:hypothetical protein